MSEDLKQSSIGIFLDEEKYESVFEVELKPLRSKNARTIYKIFLENANVEILTTLDLQDQLKSMHIILKKKEINAWLKNLQEAGLISKRSRRGKPTTINYERKYTYDLWELTQKGKEIARKIENFLTTETILNSREVTRKVQNSRILFREKERVEYKVQLSILRAVSERDSPITFELLQKTLAPSLSFLEEMVTLGVKQGQLQVRESTPRSLKEKILRLLGISRRGEMIIEITDLGREFIERQL